MPNNSRIKPYKLQILGTFIAASILISGVQLPSPVELIAVSKAAVNDANLAGANELARYSSSQLWKRWMVPRSRWPKRLCTGQAIGRTAQVDAKLAVAMARSAKAKKAADALQEDSRVLSQEIGRKTK